MLIRALKIGQGLKVKDLAKKFGSKIILKEPYLINFGKNKFVTLFRYGVMVFFNLTGKEEQDFLKQNQASIIEPNEDILKEEMNILLNKSRDKISSSVIHLADSDHRKIALIAETLSRSLALEYFETEVGKVLFDFGEITEEIRKRGKIRGSNRLLLQKVGFAMNVQHSIVNQLAMLDKPEITWDYGGLDHFYSQLIEEYEINERYRILNQKLEMIFRDIEFIMNYIDARRNLWLEVTIVILIVIEIVLFLAELFWLK